MRALFFLLAFSLVLQNTCPHGFAAKTVFAAPQTHDCPFKKSHNTPGKDHDSVDDNSGRPLYPAFVLSVPDVRPIIFRIKKDSDYMPLSSAGYKDPFKEPSLKPPVV